MEFKNRKLAFYRKIYFISVGILGVIKIGIIVLNDRMFLVAPCKNFVYQMLLIIELV